MGLFSTAKKESQIGIDFMRDGVAVALVHTGKNNPGDIIRSEFIAATEHEAQIEVLADWVRDNNLQKMPCVCLVADDDCDIYQVERPEVEDSEMIQAVTWKVKDLVNYDVTHAVVDCYPMPVSSKNKQQQVGVVAARETVISNYVESIKSAALELNALDVHELVRCNLRAVQHSTEQSLALLTLAAGKGWLRVYHDTELYVSREFMIGIDQLGLASSDDESVFDALLLEIQRSLDYFESFYGMGKVTNLRIFPQLDVTEKMAMYLQNFSNFDIDFLNLDGGEEGKPAIPFDDEAEVDEAGIYRHVLEIEFAGKYLDILRYMQGLEALDWKLLWDEIEIVADEYPQATVKVLISTLSTRKEWVGI